MERIKPLERATPMISALLELLIEIIFALAEMFLSGEKRVAVPM